MEKHTEERSPRRARWGRGSDGKPLEQEGSRQALGSEANERDYKSDEREEERRGKVQTAAFRPDLINRFAPNPESQTPLSQK